MAKIETVSYTNEAFKSYLMQLSKDIVWKNSSLAKLYESNTDPYLVEIFVTANRGVLNFDVIRAFPRAVLRKIGIPEINIDQCASDKNQIPENMRSYAVQEYQEALCHINPVTGRLGYETPDGWVSIYEEQNDYYRMLNGLPGINEKEFVYNSDPRWPTDIPVHNLELVDRLEMEDAGVLDKLIKENPKAEYLKYCGSRMISIYKARVANRFEILWRHTVDSSTLEEDFDAVYDSCCNLVNSVYYSDAFRKTNSLYENFLAMSILFMTIQTMQYHYLSVDVIRDFYDTESLKYVYDSYSVPFYNEIPLEYHRKIVKNINKLIGYKGSSQVFFDLFDIFDTNMNIYTYYLTKIHRFDEHGNPMFELKTDEDGNVIKDKNGNPVLSPDNYSIAFSKGEIYADPALSVADPVNYSDYNIITTADPYWIEDANTKKVLDDKVFNFNETKYIGVQTTFDLIKIAYENAHVFKMIMDNKTITDLLIIQWPDMGIEASLYEIFIYLAALVCRYHHYDGLLSDKLPYTAAVLGYDFKKSATIIKDTIDNNQYLKKNIDLKNKIRNMNITNTLSVDSTFSNMQEIESMLISGYLNATSVDEFNAYRDLYNTLMTSKIIDEVYTDNNGNVAESFSDLLRAQSPDLYGRLIGLAEEDVEDELTVLIDKIEELLTSLKYSPHSLGIESSSLIENLFRILRFFKSAKAEIIGYNIIYQITMRGINFFKILDGYYRFIDKDIRIDTDTFYHDFLMYIKNLLKFKRELTILKDNGSNMPQTYNGYLTEKINWTNDMLKLVGQMFPPMTDTQKYYDFIMYFYNKVTLNELQESGDKLDIIDQVFMKGSPLATFKDPFEFLDRMIEKASIPYILVEMPMGDFIHYVHEKVVEALNLNKENLMQYDELIPLYQSEFSSKFDEYIISEIKRIYKDTTISSKIDMIDKILHPTMSCKHEDIGYSFGLPGDESLIEISNDSNHFVNEGAFMSDSIMLSDGTSL